MNHPHSKIVFLNIVTPHHEPYKYDRIGIRIQLPPRVFAHFVFKSMTKVLIYYDSHLDFAEEIK